MLPSLTTSSFLAIPAKGGTTTVRRPQTHDSRQPLDEEERFSIGQIMQGAAIRECH